MLAQGTLEFCLGANYDNLAMSRVSMHPAWSVVSQWSAGMDSGQLLRWDIKGHCVNIDQRQWGTQLLSCQCCNIQLYTGRDRIAKIYNVTDIDRIARIYNVTEIDEIAEIYTVGIHKTTDINSIAKIQNY